MYIIFWPPCCRGKAEKREQRSERQRTERQSQREAVLDEIRAGDAEYASRRLQVVADMGVLAFSDDVERLIRAYHHRLGLAGSATADLPHFAYAVAYNMDYLVTWNCKHIANGQVIRRLHDANAELGRPTPVIVTPEELLESLPGDDQ